jgi:hypothetical protein
MGALAARQQGMLRMGLGSVLVLCVLLAGCRTFNVQTDWDPAAAFERLERFYFVEPAPIEGVDPFADNSLLRKRVRYAVEKVLEERGYLAAATRDEADFLITYEVLLDRELRVDGVSSRTGYYRSDPFFGGGVSTATVRSYQESTLVLDVKDPATEDLIWRGWGTGIVGTRDRDRGQARVEDGVRAIIDRFPPNEALSRD